MVDQYQRMPQHQVNRDKEDEVIPTPTYADVSLWLGSKTYHDITLKKRGVVKMRIKSITDNAGLGFQVTGHIRIEDGGKGNDFFTGILNAKSFSIKYT